MTEASVRDLGRPPGICDNCWTMQQHHPRDVFAQCFHCHHTDTLALPKADLSGWFCETGVDAAELARRQEVASTMETAIVAEQKRMN